MAEPFRAELRLCATIRSALPGDGRSLMTSDPCVPLTELVRDAIAELSNIAMAEAANSLRKIIQHEVCWPCLQLTFSPAWRPQIRLRNPATQTDRQYARFCGSVLRPGATDLSGNEQP
jgi:hypothetical protein